MKKCVLLLCLLSAPVYAAEIIASGTNDCGEDCSWTLDSEGNLSITGSKMNNYTGSESFGSYYNDKENLPWYSYRDQVTSVTVGEGMTKLGSYTIRGMSNLEHVSLPSTLKIIDDGSLNGLPKLKSIELPEGLEQIVQYAFSGSGLETLEIPEKVSSIGNRAFQSTGSLTTLILPKSIKYIAKNVFEGSALQTLYCDESQKALCQEVLNGSGKGFAPTVYKEVGDHIEIIDGKGRTIGEYASVHDLYEQNSIKDYVVNPDDSISVYDKSGKLIDKRYAKIYTVEEIMALTEGKEKFRVRLTYK